MKEPRRRKHSTLGQNFLIDRRIRDRIIAAAQLTPNDVVLEIGPGRGFLTEALATQVKKLWCVELDPKFASCLEARWPKDSHVTILQQDILSTDVRALAAQHEGSRLRVIANLPYFITSPILHHLFSFADVLQDLLVMVQREVAQRICAESHTSTYGYLSVACQFFSSPCILFDVAPSAFQPRPQVTSSVVHLLLRPSRGKADEAEMKNFLRFVQNLFQEKRKTMLNNLQRIVKAKKISRRELLAVLESEGWTDKTRAEELSVTALASLERCLRARELLC